MNYYLDTYNICSYNKNDTDYREEEELEPADYWNDDINPYDTELENNENRD